MSNPQNESTTDRSEHPSSPPYVSYKTFLGFIGVLEGSMPSRIDRSLLGSMSGGTQSHLLTALRTTGLTEGDRSPSSKLKAIVAAKGEERKLLMREMIEQTYPFLFTPDFDLAATTPQHLEDVFRNNTPATGSTLTRCINFFLAAAKDAGIEVSPFVKKRRSRRTGRVAPKQKRAASAAVSSIEEAESSRSVEDTSSADQSYSIRFKGDAGRVTLSLSIDLFKVESDDRKFVLELVDLVQNYGKQGEAGDR